MGDIVITRAAFLPCERALEIKIRGRSVLMDPQVLAVHATGKILPREGCVISFADGLIDAGHDVFMVYRGMHRGRTGRYIRGQRSVLVYYALGYATGRGECETLTSDLRRFVSPHLRQEALERVGSRILRYRTPATLF